MGNSLCQTMCRGSNANQEDEYFKKQKQNEEAKRSLLQQQSFIEFNLHNVYSIWGDIYEEAVDVIIEFNHDNIIQIHQTNTQLTDLINNQIDDQWIQSEGDVNILYRPVQQGNQDYIIRVLVQRAHKSVQVEKENLQNYMTKILVFANNVLKAQSIGFPFVVYQNKLLSKRQVASCMYQGIKEYLEGHTKNNNLKHIHIITQSKNKSKILGKEMSTVFNRHTVDLELAGYSSNNLQHSYSQPSFVNEGNNYEKDLYTSESVSLTQKRTSF